MDEGWQLFIPSHGFGQIQAAMCCLGRDMLSEVLSHLCMPAWMSHVSSLDVVLYIMLITIGSEHLPILQCDYTSVTFVLSSLPQREIWRAMSCFDRLFGCFFEIFFTCMFVFILEKASSKKYA